MKPAALLELLQGDIGRMFEKSRGPLWPMPYGEDSWEAAYRFVTEVVQTRLETTGQAVPIPKKEYVRFLVWNWWMAKSGGEPFIVFKSRRLIISWIMCALDVWDVGIEPGDILDGGREYEGKGGAKDFVWRSWFIYDDIQKRFPAWGLPNAITEGNTAKQGLDKLVFPNGAMFIAVNSDRDSFQGGGAKRAKCEELSLYARVKAVWGQANIVCQGPPGEKGGHAVAIANASANREWIAIKEKARGVYGYPADSDAGSV